MKGMLTRFRRLPLTLRVPITVAILMIAVSAAISERVLSRLHQIQEDRLSGLASSYLDGIIASISPSVLRQDSWEIYDAIVRVRPTDGEIVPLETVVTSEEGLTLASDRPEARPTLGELPQSFTSLFPGEGVAIATAERRGYAKRRIDYQGQNIGAVFVIFDVSSLLAERQRVLLTLLVTNGLLTGLIALIGFATVRQMVKPMQILESHMTAAASGQARLISQQELAASDHEARRLYHAYNTLVEAERDRTLLARQLSEEEKLASLGRLASGMAHEINNPLGGLMNAVNTLKKHGADSDVRNRSLDLVQRGLQGIKEVVSATLATYRAERATRPLSVQDFQDLKLLLRPEMERKGQNLEIETGDLAEGKIDLPAGPLRQALLNLLLNASQASPAGSTVTLACRTTPDRYELSVSDQGQGLPAAARRVLSSGSKIHPPPDSRGLGLWVVRHIAEELHAGVSVAEGTPSGTTITISAPKGDEEIEHAA